MSVSFVSKSELLRLLKLVRKHSLHRNQVPLVLSHGNFQNSGDPFIQVLAIVNGGVSAFHPYVMDGTLS